MGVNSYTNRNLCKNKGVDQTARMRRLVCASVVCKQHSHGFLRVEAHMMLKPRLPGLRLAYKLFDGNYSYIQM